MANKKVAFTLTAVDKTKAAFDKVSNGLKKIGGGAKAVAGGLLKVTAAIAGVGIAIAAVIKTSFQYIDTLDKTSKRTGIATDTLQAFQLAALESGSSVEQAQKGLEKFARSIGDAQRGLKTQQDIFRDLGVELTDIDGNTRDFNSILLDTADGLKGFGNETDRATALANLFGRAGIAMSEVFKDGADGIRQFTERAKGLGIIIPPEVISNVAKFNDQFAVLQLQLKAVVNNITGALAPALSVLVTDLSTLLKGTNDSAEGFDNLGQSIAISILEGVKVAATAIQAFVNDAEQTFLTFAASAGGKFFGFELTEIQKLQVELINLEKKFKQTLDKSAFYFDSPASLEKINNTLKQTQTEIDAVKEKLGTNLPVEDSGMVTYIDKLIAAVKNGDSEFQKLFEGISGGVNDIASPLTAFRLQLDDVGKSLETTVVSSMKKFEDTIITGLKNGKLEFKAFADYVVEQLLRIAIQQMILKPITGKFEAFFEGFNKKTPSGDGGGFTGFGIRAGGVDGKGGFPAILHPNETVIDHTKGQAMQAAPTVNFNISTVDAAGFDQLLASRKGLITSIINNAMNNQGKMGVV